MTAVDSRVAAMPPDRPWAEGMVITSSGLAGDAKITVIDIVNAAGARFLTSQTICAECFLHQQYLSVSRLLLCDRGFALKRMHF